MTTAPNTPNTPAGIEQDIPCERCGYNLRGLTERGLCPECGLYNSLSIGTWNNQRAAEKDFLQSDPRWLRAVAEGAVIGVVAFVLIMALVLAPSWAYEWKTRQRAWMLGVACTAWVLTWAAVWKIGTIDFTTFIVGDRARARRGYLLRVFATLYLLVPFLNGLAPRYNAGAEFIIPLLAMLVAGLITLLMLMFRIGRIAAAAGARVLSIEAKIFGVLSVLSFCVILTSGSGRAENSLSRLMDLGYFVFGEPNLLRETFRTFLLQQGAFPHPLLTAMSVLSIWAAIILNRFAHLLYRSASRVEAATSK